MGFVDDLVELPFFIKFGLVLFATLLTSISVFGFSISNVLLQPLFGIIGGGLSSISGFPINTDYRLFVIFLFLIGVAMFINYIESSN